MREYQVSYRGGRFVTRDNIIEILEELNFHPGAGEGGGFELDGITNWYLLTDQDEGVQLPDMDLLGTDACDWTTTYQPPTANTGESCVWRFTDFRYKDGSTQENPILHIYVGPELITKFTSGGGMGVEFAYALFDQDVTEVILSENNGDLPVSEAPNAVPQEGGEWTKSLDTLSYDADSYLWMSQRKISADGIPALWEKPIRLSGADGDPGKDAFDTEFIYHRSGRKPTSDDNTRLFNDNIRSQDDYCPNNSYWVWTDNPQGVDNDDPGHKYEWMAFRTKMDSTHPDYDPNHTDWIWSNWSTIRIWSAYGEKGMDGDGVQYVYNNKFIPTELNPTLDPPSSPVICYNYDQESNQYSRQTWYGDLILTGDPSESNNWRPKDWDEGIFYKWEGGIFNSQGEWIPTGWTDEPQGVGDFEIANPAINPNEPISEDNPETITVTYPFEWVSVRKRVREVWGPFSEPTLWSTFSREHTIDINSEGFWVIDGVPTDHKAEGEDGKGVDLKGRVNFYDNESKNNYINNHSLTPEQIEELTSLEDVEERDNLDETNIGDCYVVDKGYGGRNAGHIFLYLGPDVSADWELRWYDFGEFQGDGSYMHIAWAHRIWTDDQGVLCSDGFRVDSELNNPTVEYEWMGICTNNEIADPDVSRLSEYKWNYVHGKDGDNYEWVYVRTKKEITPIIKRTSDGQGGYTYETYIDSEGNHSYQKDEYLPFISNPVDIYNSNNELEVEGCYPDNSGAGSVYQFYDDPKGVNNVYRYEWRSQRKRENGIWKDFGNVSLHATYSNDGQGVIRSTVFKRSVNKPIAPSGGEYGSPYPVDLTWHDGLPTDGQGSIWMSSRIFTSDGEDPEQSEWSNPILLQDSDTLDIELSPQPKNANPVIYPIDYSDPGGNRHNPGEPSGYDYSATGGKKQLWFDPEQDAAYISAHASEFNWMATRTNYIDPSSGEHRWRDWVVVLIKGETGEPGKTFQHAYVALPKTIDEAAFLLNPFVTNPTNINTAPTTSINSDTYVWQFTTAQISVTPSQYLWMTERWIQPDSDDAGNWDRPVRISGTGTPGEDAEDIEFIYKRENRLPNNSVGSTDLPSTSESSNGKNYSDNDFLPVGGWTDNPQGVGYFIEQDENNQDIEVFYKYEWMCQRVKPRGTGEQTWGSWSKIFVWSAYGDTGMDGDGVEYIFYREKEIEPKTPVGPYYKSSVSSSAVKWTGGIVDVSTTSTPDWRPKGIDTFYSWEYGSYNEQGEWIPTHWIDNNSIVPVLSNEGDPIWTDEPLGVGEEYTIANPEFDSNQDEDSINNPRTLTKTYIHEWVSQRKRVNGSWGDFSEPTLWSNFSHTPKIYIDNNGQWIVDGVPVGNAEGPAGQGIQLKGAVDVIYQKYATEGKTSLQWVNPWLPDENTSPYSDIEPGDCFVVRQTGHLYLCLHNKGDWNKTNQDVITDESWPYVSPMTDNPNWEDIGEFQGQGSYMHIAWAASDDKGYYGTNNIKFNSAGKITLIKHFLIDYAEKRSDVDYDWMGVRTDHDIDDLPCNYDPATYNEAEGIGTNWKSYKWNNVRGRDGDNYERVYIKTRTADAPEIDCTISEGVVTYPNWTYPDPNNSGQTITVTYQDAEYLPAVKGYNPNLTGTNQPYSNDRFTDDPTGVSEEFPYEWMAERKKKLNTSTNTMEWRPFSTPALWAKYSFDGDSGASIEIRYISVPREIGEVTVDDDTADEPTFTYVDGNESTTYSWVIGTSDLDIDAEHLLWMIQRTVQGNNKTAWCDPIRLTGEDGEPGADGKNIEFIFKRSNNIPTNLDVPTLNKQTTGYIPNWVQSDPDQYHVDQNTGWEDHPLGVGNATVGGQQVFYKYEWMCQRIKPSGVNQDWGNWIGPFVWSAYGDTGMDGDGIEYVFYLGSKPSATPPGPTAKIKNKTSVQSWDGGVYLNPNHGTTIQSNDWLPKNWPTSTYGEWDGWHTNYGLYNPQGEWIPKVVVGTNNSSSNYWSDDPTGVDKDHQEEWVCLRKRTEGIWGAYSDPALWASWGTKVSIEGGWWYINGQQTQYRAEGKDGKGIQLKGSVDFRSNFDKNKYVSDNNINETDASKLTTLEEIRPRESNTYTIEIGDCYVVKNNRYLYACIHNDQAYNSETNPLGWVTNDGYGTSNWDWSKNWDEIGEFQGKGSYMHIAWATDSAVHFDSEGKIEYVAPFIHKYEELDRDVVYDWMGVYTDEFEDDPADNCDPETGDIIDDSEIANWSLYAWNHVKGKDGSDYERVYIKTKTENAPAVIQTAYEDNVIHRDPNLDEFFPQVVGYSEGQHSSRTFTDDPTGVSPLWPYEWVTERKKTLDPTDQKIKWREFYSPAKLWAVYSFDGLSAHTTKGSDNIYVDSANNIIGGLGDVSETNPQNPRLYTEIQIYDPNSGSYLNYNSGTTPSTDGYVIIETVGTNCTVGVNSVGKIYVKSITSLAESGCSIEFTAKIYNNRTFKFGYSVGISHLPRTYLSYSLTNDSDTFTYRTSTGQYDGLPVETCLKVQTTDGAVDELNDNTSKTSGYISKVTVEAKEFKDSNNNTINNLLQYAKTYIGTNTSTLTTVTNRTFSITPTTSSNSDTVTHRTKTAIIYKDNRYQQDTGLRLEVKSDGNVKLYRTGSSDIDFVDAKHDLNISCEAIVGGVTYTGPLKVFNLSEKNDATLYRLQLNFDTIIKNEDGSYDPDVAPTVKVNIIDSSGTTSVSPTDTRLSSKHIYVKYVNGPSSTPENDTLSDSCPNYNNVDKIFTVLIVECDSSDNPLIYHDSETVDIVPPGTPGSSQTYLDINTNRVIIDCDEEGRILGSGRITRNIRAQLKWGDELCIEDNLLKNKCEMSAEGFDYVFSNSVNTTKACQISVGWVDDSNSDSNIYGANLYFNPEEVLTSGTIVVYMEGTFSDGVTRHKSETIVIEARWRGPEGPQGSYKAIAFTRTNDDISGLNPTGGNYLSQAWPNKTIVGTKTYTWSDGIPGGEAIIWACTHTFTASETGTITWSNPRKMKDSPTYDVEFAYRQANDSTPTPPNSNNRHGCPVPANQIWFDPEQDSSADFTQMYWRAEKEINNGDDSGPWVISRIRGEGVPSVRLDPNYDLISVEVGPTGILASETIFYINSYIYVGDSLQYISGSEENNEVELCTASLKTANNNIAIEKEPWSSGGVRWTIKFTGNRTYSTNNELTITLKNSTYTVSRTISIIFTRKNQSKIKSFVFKRFATPALAAAGTPSGGTFNSPTPNPANGWTDGIPNDGTSNPIYMSHRTFTSDGSGQTNWTVPALMSDSDNFNVEFSPSDTNPAAPVAGTNGNMHGCEPATNQVWYDPAQDSDYFNEYAEDMIWMATSTSKDSSGNWVNWAIVKIKGETGESQHVKSCKAYYQAFNTLTVTIPSAGTEGSWTSINTLTGAGWTDTQIEPTQDNPYLWRFFRTVYENPERVEHYGLEMIQVWAEKMINPNLLDDTDFIDDNHLGGWYRTAANNTYFGDSEGHERTQYETLTGSGTSSNYGSNPKQYYLQYSTPSSGVTTTDYVGFLEQKIYDESFSIKKLSSNTWYTLYFEAFAKSRTTSGGTDKLTIFISDSISGDIIWTEKINTTVSTTIGGSSFETKFGYQGSSYGQWNKITATFKTGTLSSSSKVRIEFRVKPQAGRTQKIYIRKPKLEIGQVATDYISGDAIKDPYPRMTAWKEGQQYYQGNYGEPYLDIVGYGNVWFRCRNTHLSSISNVPVIGQTTQYWEPATDFSFVATNLLLAETAVINNLIATSLRTGERGVIPHVEMSGSRIEFYGTGMNPSIRFNVDASGTGILEFLDNDGNVLYNLGPNGITRLVDAMNSTYANSALYKITSSTYVGDLITVSGNAVNPSITGNSFNITNKYTLTEGYQKIGDITKYRISNDSSPSAFNGRMFDGNQPSDSTLSQYLANNNAEDYSTLFSDETNWYITLNYGPILSFSAINEDDVVYTMSFHQYSKGRLSKTVTIYFSETEVRNAASNLRQLYGHRIVNNVVNSNLKILPLLNL